jgi:signal transduction histidine kinase
MAHRILVVDDHDAARFVKVQLLRRAGFEVVEESTGLGALRSVDQERPDLIILDVNLPDISGLDVSRRLRANQSNVTALQILQISNTAVTSEDRVRGLEQGADVYLVEPVEPDVLIATVHALLRVHRAEKALADALENERHARKVAEEASRLKDDFIATLSHELRTPLNALMGWIWQLRHGTLPEDARQRALESLERNAQLQAQLINDLLDVSRISKGKLQLELRLVDLRQVVQTASDVLRAAAVKKQIALQVEASPVVVVGDRGRLLQVVTNLLTNAVQFTPPSGSITLTLGADARDAVLTVQDTGAGIDSQLLPFIFDPFRQGEAMPNRKHGGLGLGLAVVNQLVNLHGGQVAVASPGIGRGATFTVRLPRETDAGLLGRPDGDLLLKDVQALLIAPDEASGSTLQSMLESSGAAVRRAGSASAADTVASGDTDVVVTFLPQGQDISARRPGDPASAPVIAPANRAAHVVRAIAHLLAQGERSQPR